MHPRRWYWTWSLALVLTIPGVGSSQEDQSKGREPRGKQEKDGLIVRIVHLMPPAIAQELDLTAEQKKQIEEVQSEFVQKRRALVLKSALAVKGLIDKLDEEDQAETAPVLAIAHEVTGVLLELRRARLGFEKKMLGVLNASQKETFLTMKEEGPRGRREARDRRDQDRDGKNRRLSFFLDAEHSEQLGLNAEQQKKLSELRSEYETRLRQFLTAEQIRSLTAPTGAGRPAPRRPNPSGKANPPAEPDRER